MGGGAPLMLDCVALCGDDLSMESIRAALVDSDRQEGYLLALKWQVYPRSQKPTALATSIAGVFSAAYPQIGTPANALKSNQVLSHVRAGLEGLGFLVERPGAGGKIEVPVLFGVNGKPSKTYQVDAWHETFSAIVEVEAGTAIDARSIYKDLFEASAMPGVRFLCLAVQNAYAPARKATPFDDFDRASKILDTLFASAGFQLDLDTVMLVGY